MACGVELVEQTSRSLCIRNFSFGCLNRSAIWASECRGRFQCAGGDAFECGTPPGSAQYYCDCGGARVDRFELTKGSKWRDPAADLRRTSGGPARFTPLSSSEMASCGVELVEQTSRSMGVRDFSFGCLNSSAIWTNECVGKFRCAGGEAFECSRSARGNATATAVARGVARGGAMWLAGVSIGSALRMEACGEIQRQTCDQRCRE